MILIDDNNVAHAREAGVWRPATEDELDAAGVNAEGYMAGWFHGGMCGLTIGLIFLVFIAWVQTYIGVGCH